jgi:hypothetical protein
MKNDQRCDGAAGYAAPMRYLLCPSGRAWVTLLTVVERECDLQVTRSAVPPLDVGIHGVLDRRLLYGGKDLRMAEFTTIPDGVLLMREEHRIDP